MKTNEEPPSFGLGEKTLTGFWLKISLLLVVVIGATVWFIQFNPTSDSTMSAQLVEQTPIEVQTSVQSKVTSSPSVVASQTSTTPSIVFTKEAEVTIRGGNQWLFALDDGQPDVALSTERNGEIVMGRFNLDAPDTVVNWQSVAGQKDTGGQGIADHWHIFAHNAHWIVFSVQQADQSYLLKLDTNFQRLSLTRVANKDQISANELVKLGVPNDPKMDPQGTNGRSVTTNDMFLVAEPDGVAVGHMVPGVGTKIYRFDTSGNATGTAMVTGQEYMVNNGSSAEQTQTGYRIFGSESLNVVAQGAIKLITTDLDWKPLSGMTLLDKSRVNLAMGTSVTLTNDLLVVTARAVDDAYPRGTLPPPAKPGEGLAPDDGAITRFVIDISGKIPQILHEETIVTDRGNRPHTMLIGDRLVTTWDTTGSIKLRIDRVSSK